MGFVTRPPGLVARYGNVDAAHLRLFLKNFHVTCCFAALLSLTSVLRMMAKSSGAQGAETILMSLRNKSCIAYSRISCSVEFLTARFLYRNALCNARPTGYFRIFLLVAAVYYVAMPLTRAWAAVLGFSRCPDSEQR